MLFLFFIFLYIFLTKGVHEHDVTWVPTLYMKHGAFGAQSSLKISKLLDVWKGFSPRLGSLDLGG